MKSTNHTQKFLAWALTLAMLLSLVPLAPLPTAQAADAATLAGTINAWGATHTGGGISAAAEGSTVTVTGTYSGAANTPLTLNIDEDVIVSWEADLTVTGTTAEAESNGQNDAIFTIHISGSGTFDLPSAGKLSRTAVGGCIKITGGSPTINIEGTISASSSTGTKLAVFAPQTATATINVEDGGSVTVGAGGSFNSKAIYILDESQSTVNINGGTVSAAPDGTTAIRAGYVNISGGSITSPSGSMMPTVDAVYSLTMTGGSVTSTATPAANKNAIIVRGNTNESIVPSVISGGTVDGSLCVTSGSPAVILVIRGTDGATITGNTQNTTTQPVAGAVVYWDKPEDLPAVYRSGSNDGLSLGVDTNGVWEWAFEGGQSGIRVGRTGAWTRFISAETISEAAGLTIPPVRGVTVDVANPTGAGALTHKVPGTVTFPLTDIVNLEATPVVTVNNATDIDSISGEVSNISGGTGTLTLNVTADEGEYTGLTVTIDGITSAPFNLEVGKTTITGASATVTAPDKGVAVPAAATPGAETYTAALSWNHADTHFRGSTAYTATVVLTAATGYTFGANGAYTGAEVNTASPTSAVVSTDDTAGDTLTLTRAFTQLDAKEISTITVDPEPTLIYTHGEDLDLSAMLVTVVYDDGTKDEDREHDNLPTGVTLNYNHGLELVHSTHDGENLTINGQVIGTLTVEKGTQEAPAMPTVASGGTTATSITLNPIAGAQYQLRPYAGSEPGEWQGWQDSNIFIELIPYTRYDFRARMKATEDLDASPEGPATVSTIRTAYAAIDGTVTIDVSGSGDVNSLVYDPQNPVILTPNISGLTSDPAGYLPDSPHYAWYRDNSAMPFISGSSYTLQAADLGRKIRVVASWPANIEEFARSELTGMVMGTEATIDLSAATLPAAGAGWYKTDNEYYNILSGATVTITGRQPTDPSANANLRKISVNGATGVNITLKDASIGVTDSPTDISGAASSFSIYGGATVNLTLEGESTVRGHGTTNAGISVAYDSTLTIGGSGILNVSSGGAAGIGGSSTGTGTNQQSGTITINGGTINAFGGGSGSGIGAGGTSNTSVSSAITISGDAVVFALPGSSGAPGIGGASTTPVNINAADSKAPLVFTTSASASGTKNAGALFTGTYSGGAYTTTVANFYGGTAYTLTRDYTIPAALPNGTPLTFAATIPSANTLTIDEDVTLTIPTGATLTNNGTINGAGGVTNNGAVNCSTGGITVETWDGKKAVYTGNIIFPTAGDVSGPLELSNSVLSSTGNTFGTFEWAAPATVPSAPGTYDYNMTFKPTKEAIYATVTEVVSVKYTTAAVEIDDLDGTDNAYTGSGHLGYTGSATFTRTSGGAAVTIASPSYTPSYVGRSGTTYGTIATPPITVGAYTVTLTLDHTWYTGTAEIDFTIDKVILTPSIDFTNVTDKTYDGTAAITSTQQPTITLAGAVNNETPTAEATAFAFTDADAEENKTVNATGIALTGSWGDNYELSVTALDNVASTLEITPLEVTITPTAGQSKVYGATDPTFDYTASPSTLPGGGAITITGALGRATGNDVNTYAYTLGDLTAGANYELTLDNTNTFAITRRELTLGGTVTPKTYDGTDTATVTVTFSGLQHGDELTLGTDYTVEDAEFNTANAGTSKTVTATVTLANTVTNYTLADDGVAGNLSLTGIINKATTGFTADTPGTIEITFTNTDPNPYDLEHHLDPRVSNTDAPAGTITYDLGDFEDDEGILTAKPALNGTEITYTGAGKDSGEATLVIIVSSDNYADFEVTLTFEATEKTVVDESNITVTAPQSITYGDGTLGDPDASATEGSEMFDESDFDFTYIGILRDGNNTPYPETAAKPTLPGDYTVHATLNHPEYAGSNSAHFTIEKITLTWATGGEVSDRAYDGTLTATAETQPTLAGVINSDDVTVANGTPSFTSANAGTSVTVTATGYGTTGADAWKYNAPSVQPTFANAEITTRPLTISGVAATDRDYAPNNTSVTLTDGALQNVADADTGNPARLSFTLGAGTIADADAWNGKAVTTGITLTGTSADNYTLTQPNDITVNIAKIEYTGTKTATDSVKAERVATERTVTLPEIPPGASYSTVTTAAGTGDVNFINGTPTVDAGVLTFSTRDTSEDEYTATITVAVTAGTNHLGYNIVVTVTATALETQTIAFEESDQDKTFGDASFTNEAELDGMGGEGAITYASDDTDVATVDPTTGEVTIVGAGTATITATKAECATHAQATVSYTVEVAKATITITVEDKNAKAGTPEPEYTYTVDGLVGTDELETEPTVTSPTANMNTAGEYAIVADGAAVPNTANYNEIIIYVDGALTVTPDDDFFFGGGGGGTTTTPDPDPTDTIPGSAVGTDETTDITVTVDSDTGAVTIDLDEETTEALVEKAINAVGDAVPGVPAPIPTVTLDLSSVEGATSAVLNVETAQTFSEAEVAVTVILPDAEITLAPEALATLSETTDVGATPITVEATEIPMRDLQGMQAAQVKGYETVVSIDVFVGETKVNVPLTVSLPYNLKANENPAAVRVWYMDSDGTLTDLKGTYDKDTGLITFTITHQSYFVV
ncbi:MAG: YDG domain-containing protein, partial [Oscillospiraceae bacterium]|nr:YDG domain-containing protein [Oscillospiraceae bacterium]